MSDVSKTQGRAILYVSHNMNTIRQLCDCVIVLDLGKVVFEGEVESVVETYLVSGNFGYVNTFVIDESNRHHNCSDKFKI